MESYIQLVLEKNNNTVFHIFNTTDELESYLKTIEGHTYDYKNIILCIDNELNWEMTKIYKKRYL